MSVQEAFERRVTRGKGSGFAYALRSDRVVHVSEVPRGVACACNCIGCGQPLLARKGAVRVAHFSHTSNSACQGAPETALHRAAKQIVAELGQIQLPEYRYRPFFERESWRGLPDGGLVVAAKRVQIDRCEVEVPIGGIIPDAMLWRRNRALAVEIVVANRVSRAKVCRYRRLGQAAIEIRLDRGCEWLTLEELRQMIRDEVRCKRWIYNPKQSSQQASFLRTAREERAARRLVAIESVAQVIRRAPQSRRRGVTTSTPPDWRAYDDWADNVYARTGKRPTLEEYRAFKPR